MQFLPSLQESTSDPRLPTMHSKPVEGRREIYSWPSGWKDMKTSSFVPVVTKPEIPITKEEKNLEGSYPVLPLINADDADQPKNKRILRRQNKVYVGIGSILPPLQEASARLVRDIREMASLSLSDTKSPSEYSANNDSDACNPQQGDINNRNIITPSQPDASPKETSNHSVGDGEYIKQSRGYAIFHNGMYFEVNRTPSPKPQIDKHELRLSPNYEKEAQEEYIKRQLTNPKETTYDHDLELSKRQGHLFVNDNTSAKGKRVTFSPELRQVLEGSETSGDHMTRVKHSSGNVSETNATPSPSSGKDRVRLKANQSQHVTGAKHDTHGYSPTDKSEPKKTTKASSQRKRSPWKQRFHERLVLLNRRMTEHDRQEIQSRQGHMGNEASKKYKGADCSNMKQTLREDPDTNALIRNNEVHEISKDRIPLNETKVLGDKTSVTIDSLNLHSCGGDNAIKGHYWKSKQSRPGLTRASSKVEATATRRTDYMFQFSKTDGFVQTGPTFKRNGIRRGGSLEEWSVEYLGVRHRPQILITAENILEEHRYGNEGRNVEQHIGTHVERALLQKQRSEDLKMSAERYQHDDAINSNPEGRLLQKQISEDMASFTLQKDLLPKPTRGNLVDVSSSGITMETDIPVLVKVDSSRGYARTELSPLPMISGTGDSEAEKKDKDEHKNRLYFGSTVQAPGKRKIPLKNERVRRRYKKKLLTSKPDFIKDDTKRHFLSKHSSLESKSASTDRTQVGNSSVTSETPVVVVDHDLQTMASASGSGWQSVDMRDTPNSQVSWLKVRHPNTARSSFVGKGDNSCAEIEVEEDILGDLIQVSTVNFSEKDKPRKTTRQTLLKPERHIQRSPRHRLPKSNAQPPLPPIGSKYGETSSRLGETGEEEFKLRPEVRAGRNKPWVKPPPQNFTLPRLQADVSMAMTSSIAVQAREDINRVVSEIEKMRWNSEQHDERVLTYTVKSFISPRVVLVSSRVARCQSMRKAIRKDKNVIFIVYDFDTWSFDDIISAIRLRLDQYNKDCKMHSVLFLCGGGTGFCYFLKNFVMTPQKLQRTDYAPMIEFWTKIGNMISKLNPDEATINIMGCTLDTDKQGKEVLAVVRKAVHPNIVRIESPAEHMAEGRKILNKFFVYRRFLLWRTTNDEIVNKLGQGDLDRGRSWSELAEEADSDS